MTNPEEAKPDAWADPEIDRVRALVRRSADMGWREALRQIEEQAPFFVERMENLALGSWQLLLEQIGRAHV